MRVLTLAELKLPNKVRQEIDGPQAEQLQFVHCGQILQDEEEGGAKPCPDKRPHISHSQSQGDLPNYTCAETLFGGQKGRGRHPIVSDVNLPRGLFARIHLG